jgi:transcriptional regulator with XRE-family HTH domain
MIETLGERIRALREHRGMSQSALARELNASINAINMLEMGRITDPHVMRLVAIADLFNVSLDYVVGRTDDPRPRPRVAQAQKQDTTAPQPKRQRTRKTAPVA